MKTPSIFQEEYMHHNRLFKAALMLLASIAMMSSSVGLRSRPIRDRTAGLHTECWIRRRGTSFYTANPNGSHVRQLTGLPGFFQEWSPTGTRIAFDFFDANGFEHRGCCPGWGRTFMC